MKQRKIPSSSTHSRTANKHLTQATTTTIDSKFDSNSELCDLNDLSSARQAHNLSNAPLERRIQTVAPQAGRNGIAAYARLWSHLRTIKRPLVQVCKRTVQGAAPSRVFRIPGLACVSKWTDYGIRWLFRKKWHGTIGRQVLLRDRGTSWLTHFKGLSTLPGPSLPTATITCPSRRDTLTGPCRTGCLAKHNVP
jgi:hypothetical protein